MPAKLAILSSVALACAVAVQGVSLGGVNGGNATLVARGCATPDRTAPVCETSGGSPTVDDCVQALKKLNTRCDQSNNGYLFSSHSSDCHTQVRYGTCKIDVCGQYLSQIADGVNCGGYLQSILNSCQSGGRVGGHLIPEDCNVQYDDANTGQYKYTNRYYKLQFSHK